MGYLIVGWDPMGDANPEGSTRDRLLAAAMRLFAERGYGRTTMGDIEEAAGFARRGGTLYHYFPSKAAVLEAALDQHTDAVADVGGLARLLPLPDRRSEILILAKWLLGELDRQHELVRFVEKEGDHLAEIRDRLSHSLVDAGYRWTAEYGHTLLDDGDWDLEALAVLFVGALVNYRRTAWTFGRPPLDLTEDRLLTAWTRLALLILDTAAQAHEDGQG
jgi:AcrR family transcriptional regulator